MTRAQLVKQIQEAKAKIEAMILANNKILGV